MGMKPRGPVGHKMLTRAQPRVLQKRMRVRQLRRGDFDAVVTLQKACFPGMEPWLREQFESQIKTFAEGQLCIEYDGTIVASASSLIVHHDVHSDWHDWREISGNGYISSHAPDGDTLYGIEMMVHPQFRGLRLSRRLYDARKDLARRLNLSRIIVGGRIPGYHKHAQEMSADEYVARVQAKELADPVFTAQIANGFELRRLIPGYFPADSESRGYASFLEWINHDYRRAGVQTFQAVQNVRLAAVQYMMRKVQSFEEFTWHVEFFVDAAADYKSDFVVFPELFTTQLLSITPEVRPGLAARSLAEFTPQYEDLFVRLAIKYNINIVGGSQFTVENGQLHNVAYLFRRDGTIGRQYKLHITPSERRWWGVSGGNKLEVFDTDRGKIAILLCYDIEFPELARVAARRGARILFVPFNTNERYGYLRVRLCAQARCIENHVYVITAGCTGNLPDVENADVHYAQSAIYTPSDVQFSREGIAAECTPNIETVIVHDVDIELLRRHRHSGTTQNWDDRRRDLYRIVYRDGEQENNI
jgi:predicted amidohydrolase/GNAT superfamily N-acetyltransferase